MADIKLNKSELQQQAGKLRLYQRLLPSLELKQRQLTLEKQKAAVAITTLRQQNEALSHNVAEQLPMLANEDIKLNGLVTVAEVNTDHENIAGVKLPRFKAVEFSVVDYSRLATPVWIDTLADYLQQGAVLRIQLAIAEQRLHRLERALVKINQRVNLFDKVLIPQAKTTIKRIHLFLGDLERDAVVRSKLAKSH